MEQLNEYSAPEIIHLLGERFKEYRLMANLTQKQVAELSGITVQTISRFEKGTANNLSLGAFVMLLKAIGFIEGINQVLPAMPENPYLYRSNTKKIQRIKHANNE